MISLTTQCPYCQARFEVNAPELQRRKGYVRCVDCAHIFDGYEHIVDDEPSFVVPDGAEDPTFVLPSTPTDGPGGTAFTVSTEPEAPSLISGGAPEEPAFELPGLPADGADEPPFVVPTEPEPWAEMLPLRDRAATANIGNTEPITAVEQRRPYRLPITTAQQPTDHVITTEEPVLQDADGPAVYGERRFEPVDFSWRQRLSRLLMRIVVLLLLVLALAQAAYVFRAQIALYAPFTRPALQALCARVGCEVPFLRATNAIQITQSRLLAQPSAASTEQGGADEPTVGSTQEANFHYVLEIGLQNTAQLPQEWPTLLVSFNDAAATLLGRYEVFPSDYLTETQLSGPFMPGQTVSIRLRVASEDIKINGFKVEKFFS